MFVAVNGVRLFCDVISPKLEIVPGGLKEKPALVCLPGGPGGDHQTLRPFFDRFASLAQVIYLDPRAGGRSERGDPARWTLDQWADDLAAFCDALGLDRPIVLGVSGGSLMVQAFLARHPERAGAGILVNPCARMVKDDLVEGFRKLGGPEAAAAAEAMYARGGMEEVPAFFRHCFPHYSVRRNFEDLAAAGGRTSFQFDVSRRFFTVGGEGFRFDHRLAMGRVVCPVLMAIGAHDPVTRPEWGLEVAQSLPPGVGEVAVFGQSSHLITADEPDGFAALVERFVAGH